MLLRKMLRDIKLNKTQFISIFLMSILGVLVYAGINAEWYGMQTEVESYYEETHLPDLWIMSDHFTGEDVSKVEDLSFVKAAELRLTVDTIAKLENLPTLRLHILEENTLSSPKVIEGIPVDLMADGLWLDVSFAESNRLQIGDDITVEFMGEEVTKKILGVIIHPEFVHNVKDETTLMPNSKSFGFAVIPRLALPQVEGFPANQMLLCVNSGWKDVSGRKELEELFSDRYYMIIDQDTHPSVAMFQSEIEQNKAMGGVFPIVFFLIAALTMLSTMTRMTSNQRTQIGTLKAMGYSRHTILIHYVSYGIWIGLVGGLIGLLIGPLIIPNILFAMQKSIYTLPNWSIKISPSSFVALGLAVLCCGASSYFACRQQLKEAPAATLRPKAPKAGRHTRLEKSRLWLRFGFSTQWNLRDIMRSKIRSAMAVIGVLGCTALLIFGFGLRDSVNEISNWMYQELNVYASKINLEETIDRESLESLKEKYLGQWIQEEGIELQSKGAQESGSLTVLGQGQQMLFQNEKRQEIQLSNEDIGISYKMAQQLSVKIGDTIKWRIYGDKVWQESEITTIYRTPMGQGIVMGAAIYEEMGLTFQPRTLLTSYQAIDAESMTGVRSVQDQSQLIEGFNDMLENMKMIIVILVIAAVILGSVVLYNLGTLSFAERIRELATLKVLGFFPKQIRSLLMKQNVWLTLIGIVLGIPAGYALIAFMLSTMSASMDIMIDISEVSLFISVVGTFLLSMIVNLILSRKVKGIDMVSSLKSVE